MESRAPRAMLNFRSIGNTAMVHVKRKPLWNSVCFVLIIILLSTLTSKNVKAGELSEEEQNKNNVALKIIALVTHEKMAMASVTESYAINPTPLLPNDVWIKLCELIKNANLKNNPKIGSIALYWGAQCYIKGIVVDKSEFDGIVFLKEAVTKNSRGASIQLAEFYKKGILVSKNVEKAMAYTLLARKLAEYDSVAYPCLYEKPNVLSQSEKLSCLAHLDSLDKEIEQLKAKL